MHPPLSRIAIGIPLYLAGERFPKWQAGDPQLADYNEVGNSILYGDGHYLRNLALARLAIIPFFVVTAVVVFLWARLEYGYMAAVIAVILFTTTPIVLGFSGMAYTDVPAACMQFASFFAFAVWLKKPTLRASCGLGIVAGLALLSKMTTLLFFPAAAVGMLVVYCSMNKKQSPRAPEIKIVSYRLFLAGIVAVFVLWAGYGFSLGHVQEDMHLSPQSMPSFQHFPAPLRGVARSMVLDNWVVPAPAFIKGLATIWSISQSAPNGYLLGHIKSGGWWYFFLVGIATKTPLPFLLLFVAGLIAVIASARRSNGFSTLPAICALGILLITMPVKYDAGLRHVMVVFPLLAMIGGRGAAWLWQTSSVPRFLGRSALAALLLWQVVASVRAGPDFISYFNELAGHDPSRILVTGCDLDCGQDLFRLSQALKDRGVSNFSLAMWTSADLSKTDLLPFQILKPFRPANGWVAVSARSLLLGDVLHETYPPGAFAWLDNYQPVTQIGKTIRLYYIPEIKTR